MGLPEIVDLARNFAVLIKVQGPDPKGLKMRKHAFHQYHSGKTTLSASGMLLPDTLYNIEVARRMLGADSGQGMALVLTVASVVEPFLILEHRENISQGRPNLIPGAQIDVMIEGKIGSEKETPRWHAAQLLSVVDVPVSSTALQSIVEASSGSSHGWEIGWSLASSDNDPQRSIDILQTQVERESKLFTGSLKHLAVEESHSPGFIGRSSTKVAVLALSLGLKDMQNIRLSHKKDRGDFLLSVGSPFGILSPVHFFNSISTGSIANCYPPRSSKRSLLIADIRCLPGTEGSPVFGEHAHFIGILIRPLRQKNNGAEIQLVIPWEAITASCSDLLLKEPRIVENDVHSNKKTVSILGNELSISLQSNKFFYDKPSETYNSREHSVDKATQSVCLITINDGVWASGVLLNKKGLILTNAHLLEPWRFGKATVNGGLDGHNSKAHTECSDGQRVPTKTLTDVDSSVSHNYVAYKSNPFYIKRSNIRVRLDHLDPWIWCDAKVVYICEGPLDVALLQLESVPDDLSPIVADFEHPSVGSKAYVIGHGLFGPRCGFSPSVCCGLVAKLIKVKPPPNHKSILRGDSELPVMLETTAAVHPGCSGGAVVNSNGHMIGLVTSNAKHGGGTLIPHLNFSIPSSVLAPIFEFAKAMQDISLLQNLDQPNEHLSSIWALMPPLSPKPKPPLHYLPSPSPSPKDNSKEEKGSRFAKFISEKHDILKKSSHSSKTDGSTGETPLSKL